MCVCVCVCVQACKQLPGNQSFDRQISVHEKGGEVRMVGQWIRNGNCLQVLLNDINWGPLDHASRGPRLISCNIYMHVCKFVCVCMSMHLCIHSSMCKRKQYEQFDAVL